jgi:hypothetical protein
VSVSTAAGVFRTLEFHRTFLTRRQAPRVSHLSKFDKFHALVEPSRVVSGLENVVNIQRNRLVSAFLLRVFG